MSELVAHGRGIHQRRRWLVAPAVVVLALLGAACVPPTEPPSLVATASLVDGGILVDWQQPEDFTGTFEVQVRSEDSEWTTFAVTSVPRATFMGVDNHTSYLFRVRSAPGLAGIAGPWSPEVGALYVDLVLPVVRIDTGGQPILDRENYVRGTVEIDPNGSDVEAYAGTMGLRGRGNSTWTNYPKKPYRMRLDSKSEIMGMAAERDWALLANYIDRSQLRTWTAMQISEATDLPYTPTVRHVEVVLNGQYDGVYVLTQHNEVGPDRVDITEMGPGDTSGDALTGGYRLEIDFRMEWEEDPGFRTGANVPIVVKDPSPLATEQLSYIKSRIQAFETALLGPNFAHPTEGYRAYVDVASFIDHYLVQEVTRNQDAFHGSTFFTKERGDALFRFGLVWDFDRSMGTNAEIPTPPEGWWARTTGAWAPRFFHDPAFVEALVQRWDQLEPAIRSIVDQLESRSAQLQPARDNDAARWGYTHAVRDSGSFLKSWMTTRIDWIDAQLGAGS